MRHSLRLMLGLLLAMAAAPAGAVGYRLLTIDGLHMKWDAPSLGAGAAISYGFATEHASFPDAINCSGLAPMDGFSHAWGGDQARLDAIADSAFAMWSGEAGIRFRRARPGEAPDILIGAQTVPRRIAFTDVWHDAARAEGGIAPLDRATICFNPTLDWNSDDPRLAGRLNLQVVLAHEIGHAIGLDHPGPSGTIMGFREDGMVDRLMPGDIAGARLLYGPPARD